MKKILIKLLSLLSVLHSWLLLAEATMMIQVAEVQAIVLVVVAVVAVTMVVRLRKLVRRSTTCPDHFDQTDWFPESEHGAMYELFGSGAIQSMLRILWCQVRCMTVPRTQA